MAKSRGVAWHLAWSAGAGVVLPALLGCGPSPEPGPGVDASAVVDRQGSDLLPVPLGDLGDHPGVERSGRAMRTSDLRGRLVVADFVFTSCAGPCPPMTERMAKLQDATKGMADVRLVTFTVDPDRDTPDVLSRYAAKAGADPERWLFVRCDRQALENLMCDRFKLVADRNDLLLHSTRFVLMDDKGRGRGFYMPLEDDGWLRKLLHDIEILRREIPR